MVRVFKELEANDRGRKIDQVKDPKLSPAIKAKLYEELFISMVISAGDNGVSKESLKLQASAKSAAMFALDEQHVNISLLFEMDQSNDFKAKAGARAVILYIDSLPEISDHLAEPFANYMETVVVPDLISEKAAQQQRSRHESGVGSSGSSQGSGNSSPNDSFADNEQKRRAAAKSENSCLVM